VGSEADRRAVLLRLSAELAADRQALDDLQGEIANLRGRLAAAMDDHGTQAWLALDLHRYYTAVENILERAERAVGVAPAPGVTWHRELLEGAAREVPETRPPLLGLRTATALEPLLGFRHFLRHAYRVPLDPRRLALLAEDLERAHPLLGADLDVVAGRLSALAAALAPP